MIISRNPAETLELCYVWQKLQPQNIDPHKKTDYVQRGGTRHRLTRDRQTGEILTIPVPRHNVIETKRSRASTTNRVATGVMVGKVLSAAASSKNEKFLRFMYDPECDAKTLQGVEAWAKAKMQMLVPAKAQAARRARAESLVWPLLLDFSQRVRCGIERYTEAQLCQYMGFVNTMDANYIRDYKRIVSDFLLQLQDEEQRALEPVCFVVEQFFRQPVVIAPAVTESSQGEKKTGPDDGFVMHWGKTLTIKRRGLAS